MKWIVVASSVLALVAACHSEVNLGFTTVGQPRWAISIGDADNDHVQAVAIDSAGDVVVVGSLWGARPVAGHGSMQPWQFIAKRAAGDGSELWTRELYNADPDSSVQIVDIAIGPGDTVIIVGAFSGTVHVDNQVLTAPIYGGSRMFLAAYAHDGGLQWVRTLNDFSRPSSLTVGLEGQIFVTGEFALSTLDFNGRTFVESEGDPDMFVVSYDAQGALQWGTAVQASEADAKYSAGPYGHDVALAANGDVIVTAYSGADVRFESSVIELAPPLGSFLMRFASNGDYLSSHAIGADPWWVSVYPVVTSDAAGHVVIQQRESTISPVANDRPALRSSIRTFDDAGQQLSLSYLATPPFGRVLAASRGGLILSSAWTNETLDNPYVAPGSIEVVAFDGESTVGTASFGARLVGTNDGTYLAATSSSATGILAFTGVFSGTISFGTGPVTSVGREDIYVVVVDPP